MTDQLSTCSSFQQAINAIVHRNQFKLLFEQLFPVLIGRICEIATFHFSFMHSLRYVAGVKPSDLTVLFVIYQFFCFHLSQAMWEVCQTTIAQHIISSDASGAKKMVMALCGAVCLIMIIFLCAFWPLGNALADVADVGTSVAVQLKIYLAIGAFCYTYTFGYQNLYQVENRQLMVISVRLFTCLAMVVIECFFFINQRHLSYTLHACVSQPVAFAIPLIWLYYWNTGKSVLNVRNKSAVKLQPKDFMVQSDELAAYGKDSIKHLCRGLLNLVQHFAYPFLAFAAARTISQFDDSQESAKNFQAAQLYIFYVFGEYFRAASFAISQVYLFDCSIYSQKKMYTKINSALFILLLYGLVVNSLLLITIPYNDIFRYFAGGNQFLLDYLQSPQYASVIFKAFLLGVGDMLVVIANNHFIQQKQFLQITALGIAKFCVALISILFAYKYQFQKLDIIACFVCSDLVGIFMSTVFVVYTIFLNLVLQKRNKTNTTR